MVDIMEITQEMIDKVFENITDEQIADFFKKENSKEKCHPDTCDSECQGMGFCDVAKKFFNEHFQSKDIF